MLFNLLYLNFARLSLVSRTFRFVLRNLCVSNHFLQVNYRNELPSNIQRLFVKHTNKHCTRRQNQFSQTYASTNRRAVTDYVWDKTVEFAECQHYSY